MSNETKNIDKTVLTEQILSEIDSEHENFGQIVKIGKYTSYISIPKNIIERAEEIGKRVVLSEPWRERLARWSSQRWDPVGWLKSDWKPLEWAKEPLWGKQAYLITTKLLEDGRIVLILEPTGLYREETRGRRRKKK